MNQTAYSIWIKGLTALDAAQAQDLSNRLKVLSSVSAVHKGKQDFGMRCVQAVCDVLRKKNVDCPSVTMLRGSSAYTSSKNKFADLSDFFNKVSESRVVQDAILRKAIELLYVDLVNWKIPVSAHTILRQSHRLPATLNNAFPGYIQSGLLTKIVKVI